VINEGDRVVAVEHAPDGWPVPGGLCFAGTVERATEAHALVRYDDPSRLGTGLDPYHRESRWRAYGEQRWRLLSVGDCEVCKATDVPVVRTNRIGDWSPVVQCGDIEACWVRRVR
jgi:hypothetical protein